MDYNVVDLLQHGRGGASAVEHVAIRYRNVVCRFFARGLDQGGRELAQICDVVGNLLLRMWSSNSVFAGFNLFEPEAMLTIPAKLGYIREQSLWTLLFFFRAPVTSAGHLLRPRLPDKLTTFSGRDATRPGTCPAQRSSASLRSSISSLRL